MWAWPYLEAHLKGLAPDAPLFPDLDRWTARDAHIAVCKSAKPKIVDYRLHDARHSYAVTAIRAWAPLELVAAQLGHASTQMVVNVYGRYKLSADEGRAWERNLAPARPRLMKAG